MLLPIDARALTQTVWENLVQSAPGLGLPNFKIVSFKDFFANLPKNAFLKEDRKKLLVQSRLLFENFYVHAPFKRKLGLLDPLTELSRIEAHVDSDDPSLTDDKFHALMRNVFVQQQDAHTIYGLPSPWSETLAFLPFQIKRYFDKDGQTRFVVSKVMPGFDCPPFGVGVEIIGWSGEAFLLALVKSGSSEVGGNSDSFIANALMRMTLRPLRYAERPMAAEELIEFREPDRSEIHSIWIPWGAGVGFDTTALFPPSSRNQSEERNIYGFANLMLMSPQKCLYEKTRPSPTELHSTLPEVFEFQLPIPIVDPRIGYIRIKSFNTQEVAGPVETVLAAEFARILRLMAHRAHHGLILDIRGNGGGKIRAAEAMLQMISPTPITPALFHWRITPAIRNAFAGIVKLIATPRKDRSKDEQEMLISLRKDYGDWLDEVDRIANAEGDELTIGKPVTALADANDVGQIYQGPVVLLIDAFTYSAADIFAGGFQDHRIGQVLGIAKATGGGGARKWNYPEFTPILSKATGVPIEVLPGGVSVSMAILRSSRVHAFSGQFIENIGVEADALHLPSRDDLLHDNRDLMAQARKWLLENPKPCRLSLSQTGRDERELSFRVEGGDYSKLGFFLKNPDSVTAEADLLPDFTRIEPVLSSDGLFRLALPATPESGAVQLAVFCYDAEGSILANTRAVFDAPAAPAP